MSLVVLEWLLDSDPSIRWQVMRDLMDAPPDEVAAGRARVAREGWGARLLELQDEDGTWAGGIYNPPYRGVTFTLDLLRRARDRPGCRGDAARDRQRRTTCAPTIGARIPSSPERRNPA